MKLKQSFYLREDVTQIAKDLLGKVLCTLVDGNLTAGKIVETEAYSYKERACHAFGERKTKRTEVIFMNGGTAYVYLCYGIHKLFNVVTNQEGVAEAVLVRAVEPIDGLEVMNSRRKGKGLLELTSGPGKLAEAMGIGLTHNKSNLLNGSIWIEDRGLEISPIEASPRIGVAYANEDALLPWRYTIGDSAHVSKGNNTY